MSSTTLVSGRRYIVTLTGEQGILAGQFISLYETEPEDRDPYLNFTFGRIRRSAASRIEEAHG